MSAREIALARTDAALRGCFPVMHALRPQLADADDFVARVRAQERDGYRVAALVEGGETLAVAGFRVLESLAWGRFLYVDDLVTRPEARSRGCGRALLDWLVAHARERGCAALHLDSGTWRSDAHRFYEREGLENTSLHFQREI